MVFSSLPLYLDPFNYFQVQQQQVDTIGGIENSHLIPPPPPPPPIIDEGGGAGLLKPNSMAEQARLANIPQPETALKCPRCESTNTKFCYYNNYNLSQPRHFCKTCKRYWTRGGALRSVPVGGGLRRNKRNKNSTSRSKSSSTISDQKRQTGSSSTSTTVNSSNSCNNTDLIGHLPPQLQPLQQLPFWPSSSHNNLTADFASSGFNYFGSTPQSKVVTAGFDVDNELIQFGDRTSDVDSILTSGIVEQWRVQEEIQKFPLLANLEPSINTGLYPNFHETSSTANNIDQSSYLNLQVRSKLQLDSGVTRSANLKMEENNNIERLDLSRNLLGSLGNDRQYWASGSGSGSGNAWTDISSDFISSSTS